MPRDSRKLRLVLKSLQGLKGRVQARVRRVRLYQQRFQKQPSQTVK